MGVTEATIDRTLSGHSVSAAVAASPESGTYPELFGTYITARTKYLLVRVRQDDFVHSHSAQQQLMHTLQYALQCSEAWLDTRELLLASAPQMEQAGYRNDWIPYLIEGIHQSQKIGDLATEAELQYQVGILYQRQSRFAEAKQCLGASVRHNIALESFSNQAKALNQIAYAATLQHDYDEASEIVEYVSTLEGISSELQAESYFIRGVIAGSFQHWSDAEAWHRKALELRQASRDQRRIAWSMMDLAGALRKQQRFPEAMDYYHNSAEILDSIDDVYYWSHVQMNLGLAHYNNGNASEALDYFLRAQVEWQRHGDVLNLAKLNTNLGLAYLMLEQLSKSEESFCSSIHHYQFLDDNGGRLNATDGLAMALLAQHRYADAAAKLEQGLSELVKITDLPVYDYLLSSMTSHLKQASAGLLG